MPAMTFSRPTTRAKVDDAVGDQLGVLDDIGRVTDDTGDQDLAVGQFDVLPDLPFMRVTDIAGFDRERPGTHLQQHVDDAPERQVGGVRPVPAAPADVITDAILRQTAQRVIERLDPHRGEFLVFLDAGLRIGHVPGVRQAGIVELQHEARLDDGLVFLAHRLAERLEERLVRRVVPVLPPCEASRSNRSDEPLLGLHLGEGGFEVREIGA